MLPIQPLQNILLDKNHAALEEFSKLVESNRKEMESIFGPQKMLVIEAHVKNGKFDFLIDILAVFSFSIAHPALREHPKLAFRCVELSNKVPPPYDLTSLLQKVHYSFLINDVYLAASPKENVEISCWEGSVYINKLILNLTTSYFKEKLQPCSKIVEGIKVKYTFTLADVFSLKTLQIFREYIRTRAKQELINSSLDHGTLFRLYQLGKKISDANLQKESTNALDSTIPSIRESTQLEFFKENKGLIVDDQVVKLRWNAIRSYLNNNQISYMSSFSQQEMALNVNFAKLIEGDGILPNLLQMFTKALYVETAADLENLLMCTLLDEEVRQNITGLIFPGFNDLTQYEIIAKNFPNLENIIILSASSCNLDASNCFPNLKYFSWIRKGGFGEVANIAEVKHCAAKIWIRAQTLAQFKADITQSDFEKYFSWQIKTKEDKLSGLFLDSFQRINRVCY